jgi:hypothetical protein
MVTPDEVVARATEWRARRAVASYLLLLSRFGLPAGWAAAIDALAPGWVGHHLAATALIGDLEPHSLKWRRRWRLLAAVDGPLRPAAFVGSRGAMLVGDVIWRATGRSA